MNPAIIAKYRKVDWFFAIYEGIELQAIYRLSPAKLELHFSKWEKRWHDSGGRDINNPKIPLKFVIENGELYYKPASSAELPPLTENTPPELGGD